MLASGMLRSLAGALALLVAAPAVASAAPTWLAPNVLSTTTQAGAPRTAMAPGGATVVAWPDVVDQAPVIRAAVREPGGAFVTTTIDVATTEVSAPSVAISPRGTAIVAWSQKDDAGKWHVAAAVRGPGGGWGAPQTFSGPAVDLPEPVVAIGGNDDAWLIWHRAPLSNEIIEGVRRPPGGSWGGIETLSSTGAASKPRLVMDQAGNATAVWISVGTTKELVSVQRPVGGTWSSPTPPSDSTTDGDYPNLAVGAQGRVAVVWKRPPGIAETRTAFRDPGGAWSDSTKIGGISVYWSDAPTIAVDPQGGMTAAWSTGSTIDANSRPAGGAWAPTAGNISAGGPFSDAYAPRIAGGPSGEAIAAWHVASNQGSRLQVRLRDRAGTWGVVQDLAGEASSSPSIAMDDQGNAYVAWSAVAGVKGRAYDVAGPDLGAPTLSAPLVAGSSGELSVTVKDRWSALGEVRWAFGDGTSATGSRVTHTYATAGTYNVVVTAVDALGSVSTRAIDVTVAAPASDPPPPPTATPVPSYEAPAPTAVPTPAPRPVTPAPRKLSKTRSIRFSRGYVTPGVPRSKACHGKVTLTLKSGKKTLGSSTSRLDRKCRYSATFSVRRSLLEGRRSLTVIVKFGGNKYLGSTTNRFTIRLTDD